jgi:hypothetical protein
MKRSRLFLAFVVAISLIAAPSFAAVKAGAKCTKAGATSTTGGKKYTCVKSGSKLVWNKGVAVKAAAKPNLNPVFKPTTPSQPVIPNPVDNTTCSKVNEEVTTSSGLFKCILRSDGQLFWSKSNPPPVLNEKCPKLDQEILTSDGILKCQLRSDGQLAWSSNKPAPVTPTPTPTPAPTREAQLPVEGTSCSKIGAKVVGNNGYMRCIWQGGPTNDFLKNIIWRYYPITKVSSSKSNNYTTTPVEKEPCAVSGDTFDIPGGILECRWINGGKLQWIRISATKSTFTNAKSPVSIEVCKLKNRDSVADQSGRNSGIYVGFPAVNTDRHRMNLKGENEILIVPIDFPDFQGGNEVLAQLEYDKKWMTDWYQYFSNGQSKFNVTTVDKWLRMPKERSAYPSDAKTKDAFAADHGRRMADQAQPFINEITKLVDLRKFSTVFFFYPDGEITFGDFIIRNQWFKAKEGDVQLNLFSWGASLEGMETLKWSYYIHETLHDFGISMHAPGNGWPMSIGTNQSGISLALNPWEQFLFDWLPADQIYCDDIATLKSTTISLSPIEREDRQTKMAVIKLSPTRAIVVESHGIDKWSNFKFGDREFPPGFYSVMAYVVDLDKNTAAPINYDASSRSNDEWAWAVWQKVEGARSNQFNLNVGDQKNLADYVAVLGDSFVIEGVRIKFVGTGDYETIEISKA